MSLKKAISINRRYIIIFLWDPAGKTKDAFYCSWSKEIKHLDLLPVNWGSQVIIDWYFPLSGQTWTQPRLTGCGPCDPCKENHRSSGVCEAWPLQPNWVLTPSTAFLVMTHSALATVPEGQFKYHQVIGGPYYQNQGFLTNPPQLQGSFVEKDQSTPDSRTGS